MLDLYTFTFIALTVLDSYALHHFYIKLICLSYMLVSWSLLKIVHA
jgi:hypothetical protein